MALMSYLSKDRHGTYYFRRIIPAELRPFMPDPWQAKANWKRSLRTKVPAEAKVGASAPRRDCTEDFLIAPARRYRSVREELSEDEIDAIALWWQRQGLAQD